MFKGWIPSRYNRSVREVGKGRLLYNSLTGAMAVLAPQEEDEVRNLLDKLNVDPGLAQVGIEDRSGLIGELADAGFLVPEGTDELAVAEQLHEAIIGSRSKHLVIMPTEACNFRCTYCYQSFPRGAMSRETIDALKAYISNAASGMDHLAVSWFGGEPLLAFDAIVQLSEHAAVVCAEHGISYTADMSTNGYLLTKERFEKLLELKVGRYMITLDGAGSVHDQRRKLRDGGQTYDRIVDHLRQLRSVDQPFAIDIRINFDEDNYGRVPELLDELASSFSGDQRFQLLVRPVGRWGGSADDRIPVCDRTAADRYLWQLTEYGVEQGLALSDTIVDALSPTGSVCYAAKPNSLVIGADGSLYKCSIALEDENNQLGRLQRDGRAELDLDKMALWTRSGEERDEVCQTCFYRPSCQGNHCPLYRMRTGKRPCPHEKRKLKRVLSLLWNQEGRTDNNEDHKTSHKCNTNAEIR